MISTAELARLAHHLRTGDRVMEKDYVLSWLLIAIGDSELRNGLAFKGGTALNRRATLVPNLALVGIALIA